jgi:hypothetical protein
VGADILGKTRGQFVPMSTPRGKKSKGFGMNMKAFKMPKF